MVNSAVASGVYTITTTNLFAGLAVGVVPNGQNGWTRNPTTDGVAPNYGLVDFTNTQGSPPVSPCMLAGAYGSSGYQYAYRSLGSNSNLTSWQIACELCFAYDYLSDKRTQIEIQVKDASGNVIADLNRLTWNWPGDYDCIQFNGHDVISCTWPDTSAIDNLCDVWEPMSITASGGNVTLNWGTYQLTEAPLSGSTLGSPTTLCILIGENNYYGETLYIDSLTFSTAIPCATPTFTPAAGAYGFRTIGDHQYQHRRGDHRYTTDGSTPSNGGNRLQQHGEYQCQCHVASHRLCHRLFRQCRGLRRLHHPMLPRRPSTRRPAPMAPRSR